MQFHLLCSRFICSLITLFVLSCTSAPVSASESILRDAIGMGLTPESIAVADLHTELSTIVTRFEQNGTLRDDIDEKISLIDERRKTLTALATILQQTDDPEAEAADAYAVEQALLVTDRAALTELCTQLDSALFAEISSTKISLLNTWRLAASRSVPASFKVLVRTDEQWRAIERALRAESRAAAGGPELSAEDAALLSSCRSDSAVVAAATRLDTQLASIQASYVTLLMQP